MSIQVCWWDAETDDEIEGMFFPQLEVCPRVGDTINYTQDGTEERAHGPSPDQRHFEVAKVWHDLRFMPGRRGVKPRYIQSVDIFLRRIG